MTDRSRRIPLSLSAAAAALAAGMALSQAPRPAAAQADAAPKVDFAKDVQPIFTASCVKCHGLDPKKPRKKAAGGLRLDDRAAALKGGHSGPAIVPGDSKNSLLYEVLLGPVPSPDPDDDKDIPPMPKVKKGEEFKGLPKAQIDVIKRWIDQGANWPG